MLWLLYMQSLWRGSWQTLLAVRSSSCRAAAVFDSEGAAQQLRVPVKGREVRGFSG